MADLPADDLRRVLVPPEAEGERLDRVLAGALPDVSRARLKRLIEKGRVAVDGQPVTHASRRVTAGARITCLVEPPEPLALEPEDIPVPILYEDAHIVVVAKPPGLVVHPGAGNPTGTLVNALLGRVAFAFPESAARERLGLVHRLDKDTSGVMVVTKHPEALDRYSALFAERKTEKTYLALVKGLPRLDEGRIDTLYGRHPNNRLKYTSRVTRGKRAVTTWQVRGRGRLAAALEVGIETGRTHQIRVHLAESGHPVLGDSLYGQPLSVPADRLARPEFDRLFRLPRQALHAWRLAFTDPFSGQRRVFTAPLPDDLRPAFELLGWTESRD